jgi:hypothetical protein
MTMHNTEHLHPNGESHHSHGQIPYWRRAHHDWRFWCGLLAMLVAIGIYVGTNDLSMVPSGRQKQMPGWQPSSVDLAAAICEARNIVD